MRAFSLSSVITVAGMWTFPLQGQWITFTEDPARINAPSLLVAEDPEEKDYAWGDVDKDGDID